MEQKVKIELTAAEVNSVLQALADQKIATHYNVFVSIQQQAQAQLTPSAPPAE
jgi:hypothetical protein